MTVNVALRYYKVVTKIAYKSRSHGSIFWDLNIVTAWLSAEL